MQRCPPAGEPCHREIEAAPEEVHRAHLADEARAERFHHPVALHQRAPEFLRESRIVLRVHTVLVERERVRDLVRHGPDVHGDVEPLQQLHEGGVEIHHRHRRERERLDPPVAGLHDQPVLDEVEHDAEGARAEGDRRGREPARRHVKCDVPPMIDSRCQRQADLADDLRPQMERVAGLAPVGERQAGPGGGRGG